MCRLRQFLDPESVSRFMVLLTEYKQHKRPVADLIEGTIDLLVSKRAPEALLHGFASFVPPHLGPFLHQTISTITRHYAQEARSHS
jgi:hypothetical protein